MILRNITLAAAFSFFSAINCFAQTESELPGLWLIEHVQVGDQEMTPIARWTRIHPDGTYESGNGWLKSSEGTWVFDPVKNTFLPQETDGLIDPFGPFNIRLAEEYMTWSREEDGMNVVVTLQKIEELPQAPADQVQGLWDLTDATKDGSSIIQTFDPQNSRYIFIRWDRIYVERNAEGVRMTGYWHMNGHRPEMALLSHNEEDQPQTWQVSFNQNNTLILSGISDTNKGETLIYTRIHQFPE
jgi:hypothetical protein